MFNGDAANITVGVEIKEGVFIKVFGFGNPDRAEFDIQSVSIL